MLDSTDNHELKRLNIGRAASGSTFSKDGTKLYVTDATDKIHVIDTTTDTELTNKPSRCLAHPPAHPTTS